MNEGKANDEAAWVSEWMPRSARVTLVWGWVLVGLIVGLSLVSTTGASSIVGPEEQPFEEASKPGAGVNQVVDLVQTWEDVKPRDLSGIASNISTVGTQTSAGRITSPGGADVLEGTMGLPTQRADAGLPPQVGEAMCASATPPQDWCPPKWTARVQNASSQDIPLDIETGPDGQRVHVMVWHVYVDEGDTVRVETHVVTYNAQTGEEVWRHSDVPLPPGQLFLSTALETDDRGRVYVTGTKADVLEKTQDVHTRAYDSAGQLVWTETRAVDGIEVGIDLVSSSSSDTVYVTGPRYFDDPCLGCTRNLGRHTITIGYASETGEELWFHEYQPPVRNEPRGGETVADGRDAYPLAIEVSPEDDHVVVTGATETARHPQNSQTTFATTISYNASTGELEWQDHDSGNVGFGVGVALEATEDKIVIGGIQEEGRQGPLDGPELDWFARALDSGSGSEVWSVRGSPDSSGVVGDLVVSERHGLAYLSKMDDSNPSDFRVLALDLDSGQTVWSEQHNAFAGRPTGTKMMRTGENLQLGPEDNKLHFVAEGRSNHVQAQTYCTNPLADGCLPWGVVATYKYVASVAAWSADSGQEAWTYRTDGEGIGPAPGPTGVSAPALTSGGGALNPVSGDVFVAGFLEYGPSDTWSSLTFALPEEGPEFAQEAVTPLGPPIAASSQSTANEPADADRCRRLDVPGYTDCAKWTASSEATVAGGEEGASNVWASRHHVGSEFSPDGETLYTVIETPTGLVVSARDASTGELSWRLERGIEDPDLRDVALSPDGEELAVTGGRYRGMLDSMVLVVDLVEHRVRWSKTLWVSSGTDALDRVFFPAANQLVAVGSQSDRDSQNRQSHAIAFNTTLGEETWRTKVDPNTFGYIDLYVNDAVIYEGEAYIDGRACKPLSISCHTPFVVKLDLTDGEQEWVQTFPGTVGYFWRLGVGEDNVYGAGSDTDRGAGILSALDRQTGEPKWTRTMARSSAQTGWFDVAVDTARDRIYATGWESSCVGGTCSYATTAAYDTSGNRKWVAQQDAVGETPGVSHPSGKARGTDVEVSPTGRPFVAGWASSHANPGTDFLTTRLDPDTGEAVWSARHNSEHLTDRPNDLEINPTSGDAAVVGNSQASSLRSFVSIVDYDASGPAGGLGLP